MHFTTSLRIKYATSEISSGNNHQPVTLSVTRSADFSILRSPVISVRMTFGAIKLMNHFFSKKKIVSIIQRSHLSLLH